MCLLAAPWAACTAPAAAAAATAAATAAPRPAASPALSQYERLRRERFKNSAPADHYFGRLKMSFLGIDNTLRFEALRAGDHTTDPSIVNKVNYADDSLEAWAAEYPRDPQLAHSYYLAVLVYRKIWTKPAQEKSWAYMQLILKRYPETYFAKQIRNDVDAGFTEHYYADPLPCPTAPPAPGDFPAGAPLPPALVEPSPSPSPSPAPYGRSLFRPNVEVLPAPCATPSPR